MIDILFTHSYFYKVDPKQWRFKQPYPPLGTLIAAAVMRREGARVAVFDGNLMDGPQEFVKTLKKIAARYVVIYDDGFNYLTKMCLTAMRQAAFFMAEEARKRGSTVIVCSSDATDHYEKYFPHGVDFVVRGEGEQTLRELIIALNTGSDLLRVQGIIFRRDNQTIATSPRKVLKELDRLPFPAWDLIDLQPYRQIWQRHHGYFSLNIATTRGCPFKCNWCAKPIYGNRYNSRSPENVVKEIEHLLSLYRPEHIWMADDIFGLKPGWVQEFQRLVNEKRLNFRYKVQSRADLLLEEQTIEALARSGAETVWIGAESGSQKILDAMDKGITIDQIRTATDLLRQNGIRVGYFLQFGYPDEGIDDIESTIAMVLQALPDELGISISYPLPGTKFYDQVKGQLSEKTNWRDSDDLAMMFQGTFGKEYYRQLHRYVHSIYQRTKGYHNLKKIIKNPMELNYKEFKSGLSTLYYIPATISQHVRLKLLETA